MQSFTVLGTLREAWKLTTGSKWAILAPLFAFIVLSSGLFFFFGFIFNHMHITDASSHGIWIMAYSLASLFLFLVVCLFLCALAGVFKVAIRRARTHHIVPANIGFHAFSRFFPVLLTGLFIAAFLILPLFFVAIPRVIYITYALIIGIFFCLSLPLAVDKTHSPIFALIHSAKITSHNFLKILGIFLVLILIYIITAIPLELGIYFHNKMLSLLGEIILFFAMLWLTPLKYLVLGVMYHRLIYTGEVDEQRTHRVRNDSRSMASHKRK